MQLLYSCLAVLWFNPCTAEEWLTGHGPHNFFLVRPAEVRMHGETEYPCGQAFTYRKIPGLIAQVRKGRLEMKRFGIVNRGGNTGVLEFSLQGFPAIALHGKLRPCRGAAWLDKGGLHQPGESPRVTRRHQLAGRRLLVKDFQLGQQHRRLSGVQTAVDADSHVVVAVIALT